MAGNVSEWVMDVYRPMTSTDMNDFRSYRGNQFKTKVTDADGKPVEKDSLGKISYRMVTKEESQNRRNYRDGEVRNYIDGDEVSNVDYKFATSSPIDRKSHV